MSVREILHLGNPILWEVSSEVDDVSAPEVRSAIQDMDDTLTAFRTTNGYGRAIAAPQIGVLRRIVFVRMQPSGFCGPLINPEIISKNDRRMAIWDGCLSFPDLMVRVSRAVGVRVEYTDGNEDRCGLDADGDLSELLQHEIDHLDGILAIQRAVSLKSFCSRSEWIRIHKPR